MQTKELDIKKQYSFNEKSIIVIGCSSGPDSMALFDMLLKIRDEYSLKLICAHINHNLRMESAEEQRYLESFCLKNNVLFETMTINNYGDDNFHNEARNIRYNFFDEIIDKYQGDYLVTAHHADDLIETILMRIVRGSNLRGYSGFRKEIDMGNYKIVRPLISYTKEELVIYNENNNILYYTDSSNEKDTYTRNRYRKEILPFLKEEDPAVHEKFLKFSEKLIEVNSYVEKARDLSLSRVIENNELNIPLFLKEDKFIQKEILYYLMEEFYQDDLILINDKHLTLLLNLVSSTKSNLVYNLPNEVVAVKEYNYCYLEKNPNMLTDYEIELNDRVNLPNKHIIEKIDDTSENSNYICRLDSSEIRLPLIVRSRRLGDKMYVKGLDGTKKIKDIFIDSKIAPNKREDWPIVLDASGNVVWLPGIKKSKFNKTKIENYDIILRYR